MVDHRLELATICCQECVKVGLVEDGRLRTLVQSHGLGLEDVRLHLVQVNIIVELDDVNLLRVLILWVQGNLNVDPRDAI